MLDAHDAHAAPRVASMANMPVRSGIGDELLNAIAYKPDLVPQLLEDGAPVNFISFWGAHPMTRASCRLQPDILIQLARLGGNADYFPPRDKSAFVDACWKWPEAALELFNMGAGVPSEHASHRYFLMAATACIGREAVEILIARGVDVDTMAGEKTDGLIPPGPTPLYEAIKTIGNRDSYKVLLECGADINATTTAGTETPVYKFVKILETIMPYVDVSYLMDQRVRYLVSRGGWLPASLSRDVAEQVNEHVKEREREKQEQHEARETIKQEQAGQEEAEIEHPRALFPPLDLHIGIWRDMLRWRAEYLTGFRAAVLAGHTHMLSPLAELIGEFVWGEIE